MRSRIQIDNVHFTPASGREAALGLRGWVSCVLNGRLKLDGIAVRRTRSGRLALSFPSRKDRYGIEHFVVRPLDDAARKVMERLIFRALELRGKAS